jgi:hypothetical protein
MIPIAVGYQDRTPAFRRRKATLSLILMARRVLERLGPRCRGAAGTMCFRIGAKQLFG